ncbi:ABC transporter permease [Bergeriella denitrificans]|uniref:Inner membrane transport permease yhhJ n=1 Tax=Bergeriella denitrificans TaxID=494 RepID=A0A378UED7_BERDE|nr:ABC transporter permease [Bergeriella denitrificans]STZ75687.1 Inner membrane transport permease yhhJ [Bergeriella denitrificans]
MRSIRNILTLVLKEFRSLFADPVLMILITFMFTGSVISVAKGINTDVKNATVGIIDLDRSALSYRIRDAVQPPFFQPPEEVKREETDALMDKGAYVFILEIPPNFQRDVAAGRSPQIQLLIDATMMTQAGVGSSYLTQIINRETAAFSGHNSAQAAPLTPVIRNFFNPNGQSEWFMPVSQVGTNASLIMLVLVGAAVIRERERGTIEHLLVMPVSAFELMMSKILANGAVVLAAALLSQWLVVHLYIGVPLQGSLLLYGAGMMLFLFSVASLGIMLATVAPTMAQFGLLMLPIHIVMLLFSGSSSPRSNMPETAQTISEYWPLTQFMELSQHVMFRGAGWEIVWPQMAAMSLLGAGFLGFALLRFRKMLERQG